MRRIHKQEPNDQNLNLRLNDAKLQTCYVRITKLSRIVIKSKTDYVITKDWRENDLDSVVEDNESSNQVDAPFPLTGRTVTAEEALKLFFDDDENDETSEEEDFNMEDRFDKIYIEGTQEFVWVLKGGTRRNNDVSDNVDYGPLYTVEEALEFFSK